MQDRVQRSTSLCPVCGARDTSRKLLPHRQVVAVECLQCRAFEIEPNLVTLFDGIHRAVTGRDRWLLEMLATYLRTRPSGYIVSLNAANWRAVAESQPMP